MNNVELQDIDIILSNVLVKLLKLKNFYIKQRKVHRLNSDYFDVNTLLDLNFKLTDIQNKLIKLKSKAYFISDDHEDKLNRLINLSKSFITQINKDIDSITYNPNYEA